ncbi:MAG TPA: AAA family ATPase, partial [Haploplasma sp.]|nr:AAA family ATPase [Haploplasma sp.]
VILLLLIVLIIIFVIVNEVKLRQISTNQTGSGSGTVGGSITGELTAIIKNEKKEEGTEENRFYMLSEIDKIKDDLINKEYNNNFTLKEFCEEFRRFSAHRLKLYYDIEDIRRFVAGLAVTNIIILQGMSGTGKTSLAYAFGEFIKNPSVIVPVQPMWKERTDLIGYYNEFTKKFNETVLLQKMYEANYSESMYITVLDEINIARIEYYFAEFLSLLELPDFNKRNLDVISNKWETDPKLLENGQITLPHNMWFIGTANNDDSTFQISDKVYDRAMVLNLDKKAVPFIVEESKSIMVTSDKYYELVSDAKEKYTLSDRNRRRIKRLDEYLIKNYQLTFGNRIMQQINNYVPVIIACGGSELEAIDDILSKKVLRKLEAKNLSYVKNTAPALVSFIEELFGENEMSQCKDYVLHIEQNI